MPFYNVSHGELVNHHEFRKKFKFLFLCSSCTRSFDALTEVKECKFCSGDVVDITDKRQAELYEKIQFTYPYKQYMKRFRRYRQAERTWKRIRKPGVKRFVIKSLKEFEKPKKLSKRFQIKIPKKLSVPKIRVPSFKRNKEEMPT